MRLFVAALVSLTIISLWGGAIALFTGPHDLVKNWNFVPQESNDWKSYHVVRFVVALKKRNVDQMRDHLLRVSDPRSGEYGKYLSREQLGERYGPTSDAQHKVMDYFSSIPDSKLKLAKHGNLLRVEAKVSDVEALLKTRLEMVAHANPRLMPQRAIRATTQLEVPEDVAKHVKFISLNSPLNYIRARGAKVLKAKEEKERANMKLRGVQAADATMGVSAGNEAALTSFVPVCADGNVNVYNPPCQTDDTLPTFTFTVTSYNNDPADPYPLSDSPKVFNIANDRVYCYDVDTKQACTGVAGILCQCSAQVNLYYQLLTIFTIFFTITVESFA